MLGTYQFMLVVEKRMLKECEESLNAFESVGQRRRVRARAALPAKGTGVPLGGLPAARHRCRRGEQTEAARALVEKFDTELLSKFSAKSSNFRRLFLSCINADSCVQGLVLQRFSKSTRLPHLCTARSSKSSQIFVKLFHIFAEISAKIAIFQQFSSNFAPISMKNFQNFAE